MQELQMERCIHSLRLIRKYIVLFTVILAMMQLSSAIAYKPDANGLQLCARTVLLSKLS